MVLALSPHLDDVVFSIGGYLHGRAAARAQVQCLTVFTSSIPHPSGFALACQLDKGLPAEVDYMEMRRAEDVRACDRLGLGYEHWDFAEAPHRGYESASALFDGIREDDNSITEDLYEALSQRISQDSPIEEVLYPIGAGGHVDHLHLVRAAGRLRNERPDIRFRQYYDMPYARKFLARYPELDGEVPPVRLKTTCLEAKLEACGEYLTQLGFQFGGAANIGRVLGREEYLRV